MSLMGTPQSQMTLATTAEAEEFYVDVDSLQVTKSSQIFSKLSIQLLQFQFFTLFTRLMVLMRQI